MMDGWMNDGWMDGQMGGWMDRWVDGWMDGCMMNGWMDGQLSCLVLLLRFRYWDCMISVLHLHRLMFLQFRRETTPYPGEEGG